MSEKDYAQLVTAAHRTLNAPVIRIRDNLNTHRGTAMRELAAARAGRLTVFQLPAYAPDLNPVDLAGRRAGPGLAGAPRGAQGAGDLPSGWPRPAPTLPRPM